MHHVARERFARGAIVERVHASTCARASACPHLALPERQAAPNSARTIQSLPSCEAIRPILGKMICAYACLRCEGQTKGIATGGVKASLQRTCK